MSNTIKSICIHGFKKFKDFSMTFDSGMNILIGENESGKSTIIDALRLVFSQEYRNADKSYIYDLFNRDSIDAFQRQKRIDVLPKIKISVVLDLDPGGANAQDFYGERHDFGSDKLYGVTFECKIDEEVLLLLGEEIEAGIVPVEYYELKWTTFANRPYVLGHKPLSFLAIDTSECRGAGAVNYFTRDLFSSSYETSVRMKARNDFRVNIRDAFTKLELKALDGGRRFALNDKKMPLENLLSVEESDGVLLENRGRGCENLIKTKVAFSKAASSLDVVTLEEPENHLSCMTLRKMIAEIRNRPDQCQLIVATHSNMIVNCLGIRNILLMPRTADDAGRAKRLSEIDEDTEKFFVKADNSRMLDFMLAKLVILVEGSTEYMLVPKFVQKVSGKSCEEQELSVIACDGLSYKRFLCIAEACGKRVAVITDNDGESKKIDNAKKYNDTHSKQHVFVSSDIDEWTWEVCVYNKNKDVLDVRFPPEKGAEYKFHGKRYQSALGRMLSNKAQVAFEMLAGEEEYDPPEYVKDAIKWVLE